MERMKARTNSTNALVLSSSAKEVVSSWKSTVRVRFWRVALAALPMCHLHLIRPRKRMCYDEDNALKDQDNRQGCTAAPRNAMECENCDKADKSTSRCPRYGGGGVLAASGQGVPAEVRGE